MQNIDSLLNEFKQNSKLPIRIVSPAFGHLSPDAVSRFGQTHRTSHYFFLFMLEGSARHGVDLEQFTVENNELLFILPHQVHQLPAKNGGHDFFKLGFDENCLARLPRQYPFLIDPFHTQKISIPAPAAVRLKRIFLTLTELLGSIDTDPDLILAHLHTLLAEINAAYFSTTSITTDGTLSTFIGFKLLVENRFLDHPSMQDIAQALALNSNSLYRIVKHYSGFSPKEFLTNRLILEAKRRLHYAGSTSIKGLAYELGFNDPEYFSRLFKQKTGQTIARFLQDL